MHFKARHGTDYLIQAVRVVSILYGLVMLAIKICILLQYLHIFIPDKRVDPMYWICHGLIWLNVLFYFICGFCQVFACKPIAKSWDPLITEGHCINYLALGVATSIMNSFSDILILILPQTAIRKLHMAKNRKRQVSLIFLVGIL